MKTLRIALAQINTIVGDIEGNSKKIIFYINRAKDLEADLVVFPELSLSGYPPEDLLLKPHFIQKCSSQLEIISRAADSILAIVGLPYSQNYKVFNAAAFIYKRRILGIYKKIHLPNYGVFDEMRYFSSGDSALILEINRVLNIGVNICEDIWHSDSLTGIESQLGRAKAIINISSSPYYAGKLALRENLLSKRAKENRCFVLYCNLVGGQDELVFDGASMVFDPQGKLICRARQFEEDLLLVDIDSDSLGRCDVKKANKPRGKVEYIKAGLAIRDKKGKISRKLENPLSSLEEIYSGLVLGLKDYCSKNGFKRVVLGLSGGIDSSLVATIAVDALGKNNVLALSMPSLFSSKETQRDAKILAKNLSLKLLIIPINAIFKKYLEVFQRILGLKKNDITQENIQARIRGNLLMAFSNKFGSLVVTTGNKSELSTGYCTLYGDTAGGFAILKDVPKMLVYKLARLVNQQKKNALIPESVFQRAPTAELRKNQTDQDSLPPYPVLDAIIDAYIEKDKSVVDITKQGFKEKDVRRVISMIDKSEYKRRQYAVGVKITPKAFGRDRRMPITNRFSE